MSRYLHKYPTQAPLARPLGSLYFSPSPYGVIRTITSHPASCSGFYGLGTTVCCEAPAGQKITSGTKGVAVHREPF